MHTVQICVCACMHMWMCMRVLVVVHAYGCACACVCMHACVRVRACVPPSPMLSPIKSAPCGAGHEKANSKRGLGRLEEMSSQNLCNLVWAPVMLDCTASVPFAAWEDVARHCILKMPEMPAQSISNLLWAYAKMGIRCAFVDARSARNSVLGPVCQSMCPAMSLHGASPAVCI